MNRVRDILKEARRRRVFRAGGVYIVAAWVVLQVCDLAFESWGLPSEALRYVWIAAVACFPVALVFGWRYDLTARGILRTPARHPGEEIDLSLRRADYAVLLSLGLIVSIVAVGLVQQILRIDISELADTSLAEAHERSIVVVPFENVSSGAESEFFSDGLSEEIISLLTNLVELRVAPRSSSFSLKGQDLSVTEVAELLGADVVVEGTVRRQGDQVRITAELIDARNGYQLWSQSYDRRLEDIFAIQRDIARQVVDSLDVILSSDSQKRLEKPYTANLEAYESYLLGRDFLRRPRIATNIDSAVQHFDDAIDRDPAFAQAYAGMCDALLVRYQIDRAVGTFEEAESACHRALTRDDSAAEVYVALGNLHRFAGQFEQSEFELRRAVELNRNLVDGYLGLAETYGASSRLDEAEATFRIAISLDKNYANSYQSLGNFLFSHGRFAEAAQNYQDVIRRSRGNAHAHNNLGAAYYMVGDFAGAAEAYRESLKISPTFGAYSNTATMYYYSGQYEQAAAMYQTALEMTPDNAQTWGALGDALSYGEGGGKEARSAYQKAAELSRERLQIIVDDPETMTDLAYYSARLGDLETAEELLAQSIAKDPDNLWTYYYAALVFGQQGKTDQCLANLERAVELGYERKLLQADPGLSGLTNNERFQELLE